MNTSAVRPGERVRDVRLTEDVLVVDLLDGRTISVPRTAGLLRGGPAPRGSAPTGRGTGG